MEGFFLSLSREVNIILKLTSGCPQLLKGESLLGLRGAFYLCDQAGIPQLRPCLFQVHCSFEKSHYKVLHSVLAGEFPALPFFPFCFAGKKRVLCLFYGNGVHTYAIITNNDP